MGSSMEGCRERTASFLKFLESFNTSHGGPFLKDDPLPFKLVTYLLTDDEFEGEALDWCMQYLCQSGCPVVLASHISRLTVDEVLKDGLERFYQTAESDQEENAPHQLLAETVIRVILSKVNDVCDRLIEVAPSLHLPDDDLQYDVSVHAIKNTRRKMEDRHVIIPCIRTLFNLKDCPPMSYFAVFDGHGGVDAAVYAACHVHANMVRSEAFPSDIPKALKTGYLKSDKGFVAKSERESLHSGSTGVSAIIADRKLHVAWLGDSQVLLVRDGVPVILMDPHKPERPDEKERIEALGGCVVLFGVWRVNGVLSVSRAIGDAEHKPFLSGEPDHMSLDLDGTEDYLVLACDGLWDTVSYTDLPLIVSNYLQQPDSSRQCIAQHLTKTAKERGSTDNISVLVVLLREQMEFSSTSKDNVQICNDIISQSDTFGINSIGETVDNNSKHYQSLLDKNIDDKNAESVDTDSFIQESRVLLKDRRSLSILDRRRIGIDKEGPNCMTGSGVVGNHVKPSSREGKQNPKIADNVLTLPALNSRDNLKGSHRNSSTKSKDKSTFGVNQKRSNERGPIPNKSPIFQETSMVNYGGWGMTTHSRPGFSTVLKPKKSKKSLGKTLSYPQ